MVMKNLYKEAEHPFAPYVRILGKGRTGSRSLTFAEARDAFRMILDGEALDVQIGAFLMLLRVKEESPEELAGFVSAVREWIPAPESPSIWIGRPMPASANIFPGSCWRRWCWHNTAARFSCTAPAAIP